MFISKAKAKSIAWLLIIAGMFVACNIYTLIPIYTVISSEWEVTTSSLTWASTSFTLLYAVGLLIFGPLSDKLGRKEIIVPGMFLFSISSLLVSFSQSPSELILFRGFQGFAGGSFAPVAFAYTFDLFQGKFRIFVLSLINTGFLVAGILGQIISAGLTELIEWRTVYQFFSISYFVFFIFFIILLPRMKALTTTEKMIPVKLLCSLFISKKLFYCYAITFSLLLTTVSFYDAVSQYLSSSFTVSEMFIVRGIGLFGAILSLWGGAIQVRYGDKGSLVIGFALLLVGLSFMMIFPSYLVIMFSSILLIAAISILIPTIISVIGTIGIENRGSTIALYSFTLLVGASFGSLLTAVFDFRGVLFFLFVYGIINLILTFQISYPNSSD
ncbi:MFS transporter [Bacillus suaedaesalsae]|uniref:MFS transporter n=1 Tax=Bacillus suaedaesalsae TaxID=2810349 RepID=A0ABS2DHU9_9BACI|nr:MFS transporter [Bacillus suaedaesalsae]MBM6617141.1 MFS transporter [Bacillus suaedaesalsae]